MAEPPVKEIAADDGRKLEASFSPALLHRENYRQASRPGAIPNWHFYFERRTSEPLCSLLAMAANDNHPTWVPYEPTKDCSLGFCSFYCPQWCFVIFPPPPPVQFADEGFGRTFSPLVIAIIGILTSAFLLVSYYAIVSKYCGTFSSRRRLRPGPAAGTDDDDELDTNLGGDGTWHFSPTNGLDEELINKITVRKYKRDDGLIEVTDCAVCLGEFRKGETLRLLPKCSHAFHVPCIDTWLRSHSNCPLCRANIVPVAWAPPLQLPAPPPQQTENNIPIREGEHEDEMVLVVPDGDEETEELPKNPSQIHCSSGEMEEGRTVVGTSDGDLQPIRRSLSMDCSCRDGVSIVELLQMTYASSSRRWGGEHRKNSSSTMSPAAMKRSFSSGRVCLTRQAKGSNPMLPV
ncbi:hypothetical protein BHE74_00033824 [Ensete ventricosum]|nr:hypothetical protein BHE74_00033824 [Ensete ventricosum]